jgi:hypothetical protein
VGPGGNGILGLATITPHLHFGYPGGSQMGPHLPDERQLHLAKVFERRSLGDPNLDRDPLVKSGKAKGK